MERFLGRYEPYFYALLRIVAGFMFFLHGTQKILGIPAGRMPPMAPFSFPGGISGLLELVLGLMIMLGLLAGFAAFIASGEMAVAYFMAHFSAAAPLPIQNGGELAALYCFVFLYIASRGAGPLSLDALLFRHGARRI